MNIKELLLRNRSYRRFYEDDRIGEDTLIELLELSTLCASGANIQPLKYMVVSSRPREKVVLEVADGSTTYWREGEIHHVPKRPLSEVLIDVL